MGGVVCLFLEEIALIASKKTRKEKAYGESKKNRERDGLDVVI